MHFSVTIDPLYTSCPNNPHTVVHVHESFFFFVRSLHLLTLHELSPCSLSMSLSLFCLLVQFVHKIPHLSEWIKQLWDIYTMEYYSAKRKNKILPFVTAWMDLENIMLSEIGQSEKDKYHVIYKFLKRPQLP